MTDRAGFRPAEARAEQERQVGKGAAELQASGELLRAIIDSSLDMIQVFKAVRNEAGEIVDFRWVLNNRTAESMLGEVRGDSLLRRNPGVVEEGVFDTLKRVTETGIPDITERHYAHEQFDGWFLQSVVKLDDGVATTTKDVTEWKNGQPEVLRLQGEAVEAKLRDSEARLERALEAAELGAWELDLASLAAWRSPQHDRIFGYDALLPEWTYEMFLDHVVAEDRGWVDARFKDAIASSGRWDFECRIRRADGEQRWVWAQGQVDPGSSGGPGRMKGMVRDITEQHEAQAALRESEARHALLVRLSDVVRTLSDPAEIEQAAMRLLGEHLGLSRCYYFHAVRENGGWVHVIEAAFQREPGGPSMVGRHALRDFGDEMFEGFGRGEAIAVSDVGALPDVTPDQLASYRALGVTAFINVPLLRNGKYSAGIGAHDTRPHAWDGEVELIREVAARTWTAIEHARAEQALRESQERQAFLLKLSDALRPLSDPEAILAQASRVLGEHLEVTRIVFAERQGDEFVVSRDFANGVASMVGRYPKDVFSQYTSAVYDPSGRVAIRDAPGDRSLSEEEKAQLRAVDIAAYAATVLHKEDGISVALAAHHNVPRDWTETDFKLIEETAERTWAAVERARAEVAQRESEARYRSLFDAVSQGIAINKLVRNENGRAVDARYLELNPAYEAQTGFERAAAIGRLASEIFPMVDARWLETAERVVETRQPERFEEFVGDNGKWFAFNVSPFEGRDRFAVLYEDITDRKRAEAALRESEERFRAFVTTGNVALYRMSPDWRLMRQMDSTDFLATTADPIEDWRERYIMAEDGPEVDKAIERAIRSRGMFEMEHRVARADGSVGWVLSRAVPIFGPDGEIVEWFGAGSDITSRRAAEGALRDSEERFRQFAENSRDLLWIVNAQTGCLEYLSPAYQRIFGEAPDAVMRDLNRWGELVHPDDRETAKSGLPRLLKGEVDAFIQEYRIVRPADGSACWIRDTGFPIRDESGRVRRVAGIAQDVTEARQAEGALRGSEERFRQFAEASSDVVWIRGADTLEMEYLNPAFERVYGQPREVMLGEGVGEWSSTIHPEDRPGAVASVERVRDGERVTHEFRLLRPDGQIRWIENTDFPLFDEKRRVQRIAGFARDISELKRAQQHQRMLLAELQHRVRNTLGVIRSITRRTAATSDTVEHYAMHLEGRIDAFARVQSAVTREPTGGVNLETLVAEELRAYGAHEGGQVARITGPQVLLQPKAAETIGLAVHELATNAVKYGALSKPSGRVVVSWTIERDGEGPRLLFSWAESGVKLNGIALRRRGFGTELLERTLAYELKADTSLVFAEQGLRCSVRLPLTDRVVVSGRM